MNLASFNLNLLVALQALLQERSVTRAAKRCGVAQSSMSYSLARLRERFDDPLLVRRGGALVPTAFATALASRLERALGELDQVLDANESFDPAATRRRFRIVASDMFQLVALPHLLNRQGRVAEHIDLVLRPESDDWQQHLASGAVDLVVEASRGSVPSGLQMRELFRQRYVCIARRGHPGVSTRLPLATYCACQHLLVARDEAPGLVDRALEALGRERTIAVRVPDFAAVGRVVASTELIATVPELVAQTFAKALPLKVLKLPFTLRDFGVALYWHERYASDQGLRWLRALLEETVTELGLAPGY